MKAKQEARTANSTYPKGGVSCSKDSFVVNQTLVFQIKFCCESPALRVAANRYASFYNDRPEFNNIKQKANQNVNTWLNENNQ
jgi:hypothetical protein